MIAKISGIGLKKYIELLKDKALEAFSIVERLKVVEDLNFVL